MREMSSEKNGQACQEEIVLALKDRVATQTRFLATAFRSNGWDFRLYFRIDNYSYYIALNAVRRQRLQERH